MSDQSGVSSEAPVAPQEPTTATPEAPAAAPPPDLSRLYERMDQMTAQQQAMAEQFGQAFAPEEEPEPDYYDETGDLTEDGIRSVVSSFVDERLQAALEPRERAAQIDARDGEWEALKSSYPDLNDRDTANAVIGDAMRWAQAHNPDLIDRPEFVDVIEWVYRARMYDESAAAQQQAQPNRVVLEGASGAGQDVKASEVDWGERIVKAAERLRPQI